MSINPLQQPANFGQPIDLTQAFTGLSQAFQQYGERAELQRMQQARQQAMQSLYSNPNAGYKEYAQVAMMMPKDQAELILKSGEMLDKGQLQKELSYNMQVMSALKANPQIGIDLLNQRAEAAKNSGKMDQFQVYNGLAQAAQKDPLAVANHVGLLTAAIPGSKDALEGAAKLGAEARAQELQPALVVKGQAEATNEAVKAKYADSMAAQDLAKKGWDITKLQEDIKINRLNSQIAAMNAATAKETNALKRDELKLQIQDKMEKRDSAIREKAAEVESARADMDNFLNTADRILKTPKSIVGSAAGPISARIPTTWQDTADFEALVDTLKSQAFMSQIPKMKGTGALSEGEGKKLQASLQNLSLSQSPEQLLANVKEAQRLILKGRSLLAKKAGIPDTVPETPAAAPTGNDIDALLKKYGGK